MVFKEQYLYFNLKILFTLYVYLCIYFRVLELSNECFNYICVNRCQLLPINRYS